VLQDVTMHHHLASEDIGVHTDRQRVAPAQVSEVQRVVPIARLKVAIGQGIRSTHADNLEGLHMKMQGVRVRPGDLHLMHRAHADGANRLPRMLVAAIRMHVGVGHALPIAVPRDRALAPVQRESAGIAGGDGGLPQIGQVAWAVKLGDRQHDRGSGPTILDDDREHIHVRCVHAGLAWARATLTRAGLTAALQPSLQPSQGRRIGRGQGPGAGISGASARHGDV